MPFYPTLDDSPDYSALGVAKTNITPDSQRFASSYLTAQQRGPLSSLGGVVGFAGASALDLIDTVGSSIIPGVQRQDINQKFLGAIGSPGLTGWFDANRGAIEVGSGIAGVIGAEILTRKITAPASVAMTAIRGLPWVGRVATLDRQYTNAVRLAQLTTRSSAFEGAMGAERFIGTEMSFSALGAKPLVTTPLAASRGVMNAKIAQGAFHNAVLEGVMATGLHTNSMLYSDDVGHNIAWSVAGLGIGGAVDSMIGAYTLRKIANSESIRRLNAAAYDVSGKESGRLYSAEIARELSELLGTTGVDNSFMFAGGGAHTDKITSLAIDAAELSRKEGFMGKYAERARRLFGRREALATPKYTQAQEELQKVTVKGLNGVPHSGFSTQVEGLGAPVNEAIFRDPTAYFGLEEIGTTPEHLTRAQTHEERARKLKTRFDRIQELLSTGGKWKTRINKDGTFTDSFHPFSEELMDSLRLQAKELHFKSSLTGHVMLEPGEWMPMEMAEVADSFTPFQPVKEGGLGSDDLAIWSKPKGDQAAENLAVTSDGELFLPAGRQIDNLTLEDSLDLFQLGNKAVRDLAAMRRKLTLPQNPNWFQLDMAEQLIKATGDPQSVIFPSSMTRESAQVESFAQKVDILKRRQTAGQLAKNPLSDVDVFKTKIALNLPRLTAYQSGLLGTMETPLDILIGGFKDGNHVRTMPFDELLKGINDSRQIVGFTEQTAASLSELQGKSFNFLMDRDGTPMKPILGYRRPLAPAQWNQNELLVRQVSKQLQLRESLLGQSSDAVTRDIVNAIVNDPNAIEARKVIELADDQHRSFLPGVRNEAPQTAWGAAANAITSREFRDRDNPIMLAASRIKELQMRVTQEIMRKLVTSIMGDSITLVNSPRNLASKVLLDQFYSFRKGWELLGDTKPVALPNGQGYGFVLDHESVSNQKRFAQMFDGSKLEKGQHLLNPNGQMVTLDKLGFDTLRKMQELHGAELEMKNSLLRSMGLPEIKRVPWYVPPADERGKYVAYTFDAENNVVPGMRLVADSPEELAKLKAEVQKDSSLWKNGYIFRSRDQIGEFMNLFDKAQMDYVAPNTTAIQPRKSDLGRAAGPLHNTSAFNEALVTVRDSMISHGDDILEILFDDVIKSAQSRAVIAKAESAVGKTGFKAESHSSIYDRFLQNLRGRNALTAKDSFFGDLSAWGISKANGLLKGGPLKSAADTYGALREYLATARPGDKGSEERFKVLTEALGPYMPFKSTNQMLEREGVKTPKELADITAKISWFEATSRLRWFESMHAVANVGGILANTSSVIRALHPMNGESIEEAARRTGNLAMMVTTPEGKSYPMLNVPKLLWTTMKEAWKKAPDEFTKKALARGYMDQDVAEFNRQWGSIDSKDGWRGFMFGDPGRKAEDLKGPFKGARAKVATSGGLDKWLSILSDKSEAFTRQWGMYIGREVAKVQGIHGVDDQLSFAHQLTNQLIANYNPANRPEIFQGALGAPIGLFQSYVMNYYQRMFRYLETENHRALAQQFAAQSAVFGVGSLPGWQALNWAFFDHQQGDNEDPVDSIYRRFDPESADLIMHGTLSNLPKMFGVDGMSLYTRGDSQVRMPVVNMPVADTVSRVWHGLGALVDSFQNQNGVSGQQVSEILSNMITNRPLSGLIEVLGARGVDTDNNGQVVSQTAGFYSMDSVYRALGVRSMQQQKEVEAFYANKNAQTEQASRKSALNAASRAAIRARNYDALPGIFADYVDAGGDPRHYSQWVKRNAEAALQTRGERQLEKALKNPNNSKNAYISRLIDAQVPIGEEDSDGDYGRQSELDAVIARGWETNPEPPEPGEAAESSDPIFAP